MDRSRSVSRRRAAAGALVASGLVVGALAGACASEADDGAARGPDGAVLTAEAPARPTSTSTSTSTTRADDATDPDVAPEACTLLREAEVSEAFGEAALTTTDRTDECWWSSADDLRTANLIRRTDDLAEWRSGYDNGTWRPNGLGDEGYTSRVLGSVVWRVGDDQYEVNVVYSTSGDEQDAAAALAELAAARL